jgi:hypothetical protein
MTLQGGDQIPTTSGERKNDEKKHDNNMSSIKQKAAISTKTISIIIYGCHR